MKQKLKINRYEFLKYLLFITFLMAYELSYTQRMKIIYNLILVLLICGLLLIEYKRTRRVVSPLFMWYFFWLFILVVARMDLQVYSFNSLWNDDFLKIILLATLIFFCFYDIGKIIGNRYKNNYSIDSLMLSPKRFSTFIIYFQCLAIVAYFFNVFKMKTIPQFSNNVDVLRRTFVITKFYSVVNVCRFTFALVPIALKIDKSFKRRQKMCALSLGLAFLELMSGWRAYSFQSLIMFLSVQILISDINNKKVLRKNKNRIVIAGIVALVAIAYITITRANMTGSFSNKLQYVLQILYLYIAPNFINLQTAIKEINPKGYLFYTLEGIWGIFISNSDMPGFENINKNIGAFNVGTYMLQPYADMGIWGIFFWTALIALIAGVTFKKSINSKSILALVLTAIINVIIFNMHNGFFLRSSSIVMWILLTYLVSKFSFNYEKKYNL